MSQSFKEYFIEKYDPGCYEPVEDAKGEKRFIAKHKVQKHTDPEGNGEDVFAASKVKTYNRSAHRYGNNPGEDLAQYEDWDHGFSDDELQLIADTITEEEFDQLDELSQKLLKKYVRHAAYDLENHAGNMRELENFSDQTMHGGPQEVARKIDNRHGGIKRALNKLTKEENLDERVLTTAARKHLSKKTFGLPGSRKYPMPDREHAALAKAYAEKNYERGKLSASAKAQIDAKANKKLGEDTDLTELSKHTLVSYANKAALDSARAGQKYERAGRQGEPEARYRAQKKLSNRVHGITKAAGRLAYGGGHALSRHSSSSGITVREGKTFKDSRKYFGDEERMAMKKRFQARMQARKEDES